MPTLFLINKIMCNNNERNLQTQEQQKQQGKKIQKIPFINNLRDFKTLLKKAVYSFYK